jgi:hypothetical protein
MSNLISGHTESIRIIFIRLILMIFIFICSDESSGQPFLLSNSAEGVTMYCDRTLYVTGEMILFSVFLHKENPGDSTGPSRVLYCEVITPGGEKITGNKFMVENYSCYGSLVIPDALLTGYYYLRAYTKVMRNYGPGSYSYIRINIINPSRTEVQTGKNNNFKEMPSLNKPHFYGNENSFRLMLNKNKYLRRDTVRLLIDLPGINDLSACQGMCLSVVPEYSFNKVDPEITGNLFSGNADYYPAETRGLSITGKIKDNKNGRSIPGTPVNLSIIGRGKDFIPAKTDSEGRFFIYLPDYEGRRDLFISAAGGPGTDAEILVDNDFCVMPVDLPSPLFKLTDKERECAYKIAVNFQLENHFKKAVKVTAADGTVPDNMFYGSPSEIIYIDDFIQLPTVEDYFNELPSSVKVRKHQGVKYFKIIGGQAESTDFKPLVMVDMVAVDNISKILAISPTDISRIELVRELYVKGDQTYGGIINFISKKGNFAGIDLPSSGIFINYRFFAPKEDFKVSLVPLNEPDTRNTVFWDPQLIANGKLTENISFTTSDTPGKYIVLLRGLNVKGEIFSVLTGFEVTRQIK